MWCGVFYLILILDHILKPDYAFSGKPDTSLFPTEAVIWSPVEIIKIRESSYLARKILEEIKSIIKPGVTTEELDEFARELIVLHKAYPSLLNYRGYPKSIHCSVNNVIGRGVPDGRALEAGDLLSVELSLYLSGYHGSCSDTVPVGRVEPHALKLLRVASECADLGLAVCKPGNLISSIGRAISQHARAHNCAVVREITGHGIGETLAGEPHIYHCPNNILGRLVPGMIFTIEPLISEGDRRIGVLEDGWTLVTQDNSRTAQRGHTVLITSTGAQSLSTLTQ